MYPASIMKSIRFMFMGRSAGGYSRNMAAFSSGMAMPRQKP